MTCEHSDLCRMLSAFEPGILPNDVFHAIARLVVLPTFVVIPLLRQGDRIMVSLQVRDAADPHYGLMLHPAGTVIRPSDASMSAVYDRSWRPNCRVQRSSVVRYSSILRSTELRGDVRYP
jgi:hypothetical protein